MLENIYFMRDSTNMALDPLSDILTFACARSVVSGDLAAGGNWAVRFPPPQKVKFFAIIKGQCCLIMDGEDDPLWLGEGDVFLLTQRSIVLASGPEVEL